MRKNLRNNNCGLQIFSINIRCPNQSVGKRDTYFIKIVEHGRDAGEFHPYRKQHLAAFTKTTNPDARFV